jgi:ribosomal protein S9
MSQTKENKVYHVAKRKSSRVIVFQGKLKGIFFGNTEYNNFQEYQKEIFSKFCSYSYDEILSDWPSVYSKRQGGGEKGQFEAFCRCINSLMVDSKGREKVLKRNTYALSFDSRRKYPKLPGGKGNRAKRQKSYR